MRTSRKRWILCCLIFTLVVYTAASFYLIADDENTKDLFCGGIETSEYAASILHIQDSVGEPFYNYRKAFQPPQPIISYLARYEKSPPGLS